MVISHGKHYTVKESMFGTGLAKTSSSPQLKAVTGTHFVVLIQTELPDGRSARLSPLYHNLARALLNMVRQSQSPLTLDSTQ